jgi:hypothetical protein
MTSGWTALVPREVGLGVSPLMLRCQPFRPGMVGPLRGEPPDVAACALLRITKRVSGSAPSALRPNRPPVGGSMELAGQGRWDLL